MERLNELGEIGGFRVSFEDNLLLSVFNKRKLPVEVKVEPE